MGCVVPFSGRWAYNRRGIYAAVYLSRPGICIDIFQLSEIEIPLFKELGSMDCSLSLFR